MPIKQLLYFILVGIALIQPRAYFAIAGQVNQFRSITINEAPLEVREEVEHLTESYHLKMIGVFSSDEPGPHLTLIRVETASCKEFWPTYIKYTVNGLQFATQSLVLRCAEWMVVGDTHSVVRSGNEVASVTSWIELRTEVGEVDVTFGARLGPSLKFLNDPK